jgi:DNA-binding NarL/FixJ family response regulator
MGRSSRPTGTSRVEHGTLAGLRIALLTGEPADTTVELLAGCGAEVRTNRQAEDILGGAADQGDLIVVADSQAPSRALEQVAALVASGRGPVVVVTDFAGLRRMRLLLAAGARGIVLDSEVVTSLVPAVLAVASGQICIPSHDAPPLERPVLTIREKQVIGLVALGLKNGEIAERLFLAESTVKSHLSSAFAKLGVRSRHEAIDLIVDPASGMGLGILSLETEPVLEIESGLGTEPAFTASTRDSEA